MFPPQISSVHVDASTALCSLGLGDASSKTELECLPASRSLLLLPSLFPEVDPHPLCCLQDLLSVASVSLGDLSLALPGSSGLLPEALSDPDSHPLATVPSAGMDLLIGACCLAHSRSAGSRLGLPGTGICRVLYFPGTGVSQQCLPSCSPECGGDINGVYPHMSESSDNRSCFPTKLRNLYWSLTQFVYCEKSLLVIIMLHQVEFSWLNIWCGFFLLFFEVSGKTVLLTIRNVFQYSVMFPKYH